MNGSLFHLRDRLSTEQLLTSQSSYSQLPWPRLRKFQIMSPRFGNSGLVTVICAAFNSPLTSFFDRLVILFETGAWVANAFGVGSCFESPSREEGVGGVNSRHQSYLSNWMARMSLLPIRQQLSGGNC